jgi:hypothetical protein
MRPVLSASRRLVEIGLVTLLVAGAWGANRSIQAQQQGQLFISVVDQTGKPLADLAASDVSVQVDDVECKIVKVEPVSKTMKVTLMVDNGNAASSVLSNLRSGVKGFIEAIPEGVPLELLTTAPQPRWLEHFTTDREKLLKAVDRLTPDSGAALFFDALVEAGNRVDKEKADYLPVFVTLASDLGRNSGFQDREYTRLQQQIVQRGITVQFILFNSGVERQGTPAGGIQAEVGIVLTKLSGGRFENIAAQSRFATLMPEIAKQIADSNARQTHQFRITYERAKDSKAPQKLSARVTKAFDTPRLSLDGHLP